ncbi:glycosyltransferase family 2 protein [Halosquirtibacter xylanolyticus]|uniref:glycosyltransferase family 2 protein n=1 Tax=Halosquirtibacter xylanolyticus TaxID=3374599 RepID=UPI0037499B30|nr:glycosyltransferase family 2 protein [Prolixibacteraceae bacterium]
MHQPLSSELSVAVVILNWNGASLLEEYLPSLVAHSTYDKCRLIVADNGSTDQSKRVVDNFDTIEWLPLDKNYGFALGYNMALQLINSDVYILLNSDIRVSHRWLEPLMEVFNKQPEVGILQPKILDDKRRDHFEYAGAAGGYLDSAGYPFCRGRIMDHIEKDTHQYDNTQDIFWASGASLAIRSTLWHDLNGFDTIFWAHMEEIDLCWRALNQGTTIKVEPQSRVFHLGGGSLPYGNPKKTYLNFRNNLFLLARNLHPKEWLYTLFIRMILDGVASVIFLFTGEYKLIPSVLKAHRDFYLKLPSILRNRKDQTYKRKSDLPVFNGVIPLKSKLRSVTKFSQLHFKI